MNALRHLVFSLAIAAGTAPLASAHCDTVEGPVVSAARAALTQGDVRPVLMWIKPADEPAIRAAFDRTLTVRRESKAAAGLADLWFFETLVRVHRAGEGAAYTGLKSDAKPEPAIEAEDRALTSGHFDEVGAAIVPALAAALRTRFERARTLRGHAADSVEAGRAYVAAYVDFVHFAERLASFAAGHGAPAASAHQH